MKVTLSPAAEKPVNANAFVERLECIHGELAHVQGAIERGDVTLEAWEARRGFPSPRPASTPLP